MVTVCMGLGSYRCPKTPRPQNLPEQGLPKHAGPAWEIKGRPDPLTFPTTLKKQEGPCKVKTGSRPHPLLGCVQASLAEKPPLLWDGAEQEGGARDVFPGEQPTSNRRCECLTHTSGVGRTDSQEVRT